MHNRTTSGAPSCQMTRRDVGSKVLVVDLGDASIVRHSSSPSLTAWIGSVGRERWSARIRATVPAIRRERQAYHDRTPCAGRTPYRRKRYSGRNRGKAAACKGVANSLVPAADPSPVAYF